MTKIELGKAFLELIAIYSIILTPLGVLGFRLIDRLYPYPPKDGGDGNLGAQD